MHSIAFEKAFPMMCLDLSFVAGQNLSILTKPKVNNSYSLCDWSKSLTKANHNKPLPIVYPLLPLAQSSPFMMKDVNSRGAQIRFAQGRMAGNGRTSWRNNPNSSRPKGKRK